jgi:LCP family protein required for cell wall assembly
MNTKTRQKGSVSRASLNGFIGVRRDYTAIQEAEAQPLGGADLFVAKLEQAAPTEQPIAARIPGESLNTANHFDLPRYVAPERPLKPVRKKTRWQRHLLRLSAASLGLFILFGGVLFWRGYVNLHRVFQGTNTVAALSAEKVAPELLNGEGDGRVNILMMGVGGKNHPGGDLTDTIMVLSVDPVNKKAAMLSVPRDLWVKMPVNYFGSYQKLNAAYSSGKYKYLGKNDMANNNQQAVEAGFASVTEAVSSVLGININYHMLVDFQAFEQAVNTVGGVTLDVKEQLYDPTMAWENANNPVLAPLGSQTMDGKRALMYARSRETSSDFARSERQRQLLIALKQKVLTLGTLSSPAKIDGLLDAFGDNVRTDLSPQAANRLVSIMRDIDDSDIASLSLTSPQNLVTTDRVGNSSVVRPRAGFNVYSDIQQYVRSQLQDGYLVKERASVYVAAATEKLRVSTTELLSGYGYAVSGSTTTHDLPAGTTIVDLTDGAKPYTLHYLQDRYGIAAVSDLPQGISVPDGIQFAIIIGT